MPQSIIYLTLLCLCCTSQISAASQSEILAYYRELMEKPKAGHFTPPSDWILTDHDKLPGSLTMIASKPSGVKIPPTINVAEEDFDQSLDDYIAIIKEINRESGYNWRELGSIQTAAGRGHLSQRDVETEWGTIRQMHVVLIKNQRAYIVTATAPLQDFPQHYKSFSQAFKSFAINN